MFFSIILTVETVCSNVLNIYKITTDTIIQRLQIIQRFIFRLLNTERISEKSIC